MIIRIKKYEPLVHIDSIRIYANNKFYKIMDILPTIQPNVQELELEASFSSSSDSSSNSLLDMSDIMALCDKDVRLSTNQIKSIFKSFCNRISQIQLSMAIKEGNLRMSGSLSDDKNKDKQVQPQDEATKQKPKQLDKHLILNEEEQFNLQIMQKTKSEMENKPKKQVNDKKVNTENVEAVFQQRQLKIVKTKSEKKNKQKVSFKNKYTTSSLNQRIMQVQFQLEEIKSIVRFSSQASRRIKEEVVFNQQPSNFVVKEHANGLSIQFKGKHKKQSGIIGLKKSFEVKIAKIGQRNIGIGIVRKAEKPFQHKQSSFLIGYCGKNDFIFDKNAILSSEYCNGFNIGDRIKVNLISQNQTLQKVEWYLNNELKLSYTLKEEERSLLTNWSRCIIFANPGDTVVIS